MKERYLSKTPFLTFVYISKCNINLPGYFGNSKKRFLWTGLVISMMLKGEVGQFVTTFQNLQLVSLYESASICVILIPEQVNTSFHTLLHLAIRIWSYIIISSLSSGGQLSPASSPKFHELDAGIEGVVKPEEQKEVLFHWQKLGELGAFLSFWAIFCLGGYLSLLAHLRTK